MRSIDEQVNEIQVLKVRIKEVLLLAKVVLGIEERGIFGAEDGLWRKGVFGESRDQRVRT